MPAERLRKPASQRAAGSCGGDKDARCVRVSSARGSAGRPGARGGRPGAGPARAAAAGVEPDPEHLLTGAPRFAPAGREGVPGFPWRA